MSEEQQNLEHVATEALRYELSKRDQEERKTDMLRAAMSSAEEGFAIIVDTVFETIEKLDSKAEQNREEYDDKIVASLKSILSSYWNQQERTWKKADSRMPHSLMNFNDLAVAAEKEFSSEA
jgi:hypothetical protein